MALLTPQTVVAGGLNPVYTAVNASDTFPCGDRYWLHVKTSGTIITVTVNSTATCSFGVSGSAHNNVVAMPATGERLIGPLRADRYQDPTSGVGSVGYSPTTGGTAALLYIPPGQ